MTDTLVANQRLALEELLTAAETLLAAIEDATGQFDTECAALDAACGTARAAIQSPEAMTIQELLAQRGEIALIWSVDDVQQERPYLTTEQAWQVLREVERDHDAMFGVSWDTLTSIADDLFGPPAETDAA